MGAPFDPLHPSALAIYCSDGRFTRAVEELCQKLGHERLDTMTFPGGPALLTHWPADLSEVHVFSRATHFLIETHKISRVVLLAHEGCGFYRTRCGAMADAAIKEMQLRHLRVAHKALAWRHADLEVSCYYARVDGREIAFEELTP
jgi:carbonic anhydrase